MPYWTYDADNRLVYVNPDGSTTPADSMPQDPYADPAVGPQDPYAGGEGVTMGPTEHYGEGMRRLPAAGPPAPPAPAPNSPEAQSWSYSSSYSGFDPAKVNRAARGFEAEAGPGGTIERAANAEYDAAVAPYEQIYADRKNAVARPGEVAGAQSRLSIEQEMAAAGQEILRRDAAEAKQFAEDEANYERAAELVINQKRAEYENQVRQFAAMQVDPGQLWANAGSIGRGQMLAAVFLEGFLAPVGVKSSATDTINRMIDRNIDAQVANINQKGKAVGLFRDLWEMAGQQSASERERRLRVRGLHLAALRGEAQAEMARFDAPLAKAKAVEQLAALDLEAAKVFTELDKLVRDRAMESKRIALTKRQQDIQAAAESRRIALAEREQAWKEKMAEDAKKAPQGMDEALKKTAIYDPETKTLIGFAPDDVSARHLRDRLSGVKQMQDLLKVYGETQARMDPLYDGPGGKLTQSEGEAKLRALQSRYVSAKVLMLSGKSATEQEAGRIEIQAALERWGRPDTLRVLGDEAEANDNTIRTELGNSVLSPDRVLGQDWRGGAWGGQLTTDQGFSTSSAMATEGREQEDTSEAERPWSASLKRAVKPNEDHGRYIGDATDEAIEAARQSGDRTILKNYLRDLNALAETEAGRTDPKPYEFGENLAEAYMAWRLMGGEELDVPMADLKDIRRINRAVERFASPPPAAPVETPEDVAARQRAAVEEGPRGRYVQFGENIGRWDSKRQAYVDTVTDQVLGTK